MIDTYWRNAFPNAKFIRYYDDVGSYEGWGGAIAQMPDGTWSTATYAHCSCYGPEDSMTHGAKGLATMEDAYRDLGQSDREHLKSRGQEWRP